ncbi:glycosyltransferase family 4 protein [Methylobacterium nigriterrae]|uniref:glycosyltransferase family 4 protein n=1 Tax=Methylobacterium nigriterrae TaxID=3127512 RepID=UPI0030140D04
MWQEACTLRDAGYRVSIIAPRERGQRARETLDGIEVYRHPALPDASGALGYTIEYGMALFWETLFAFRALVGSGFDVVHVSNPPDTLFLVGGLFKAVFAKKLVFDHHDLCPELYEAKFGRKDLPLGLLAKLERWSIKAADIVISTNESYRQVAIARGGKDPSRVFVVRNGPDLGRLRPVAPIPALKNGCQHLVGYVGVIGPQEGLQHLVRAAAFIIRDCRRSDVHFAVVGSGSDLDNNRRLAKALGVGDHFTFTGRVSDQVLLEYLNTADLCVGCDDFNALNDRSTMIKIMEYMALGKPVVQFALTEGSITAREASLYARPGDHVDFARKILTLLDDPARRTVMGQLGRTRIERELAWDRQVPMLLAAYDALWADSADLAPAAGASSR